MSVGTDVRSLETMDQEEKLRELFSNGLRLARFNLDSLPAEVKDYGAVWLSTTEVALVDERMIGALISALNTLRDERNLHAALIAEQDAVLVLQRDALRAIESSSQRDQETERPRRGGWITRVFGKARRAGDASHSLSGSLREALDDLLPGWAKGTLKVGEEVWEIYGKK
ncbi:MULTISPECIES: hypothetical protein [Stenotrophomonas]|uniref:hypothetical protein n=1 Tax=Stenotrophomonas TaxID=40323 RepID=UPI000A44E93A|nr:MULTISPECIES: hypothetical protein [Stenotrophomonas]MBH1693611.1 hypothetical protein [Stenotrophomonas maltophilia]MBH1701950.1 hypothetical protein [Stenotrophomonas maltophilia]MBH1855308.1 hypothetical protein [Stenotrophomonas maltophilia]MBN5036276.1 hypothetical protein [Stenotrophomonas maltophilia]MCF3456114.1 hypothetical protein [Stenotrophomonas maltophilia]